MNINKKVAAGKCGPGGMKCPCCGPSPKHKKAFLRTIKRIVKKTIQKEIRVEIDSWKQE
jgi:hypothetical protein